MTVRIYSNKSNKEYIREFKSLEEAKDWIVNHLDLSMDWNVITFNKRGIK